MRNAFIGYTYQEYVAVLLLVKMDVERKIESIEIEADVNHKFDDINIKTEGEEYYLQIKDIDNISIEKIEKTGDSLNINGIEHKLSEKTNILFFKNIDILSNCEIIGLPAYKSDNFYIVSFSRIEIENKIDELYNNDFHRKSDIKRFFGECLDKRKLTIHRENLPIINVFSTKLLEPTINIGKKFLKFENILVIEGKPGVGKSHFVKCLENEFKNNLLYRFWISSQDKDYDKRLKFKNFIFDFSKKLFNDQLHREDEVIIKKIEVEKKIVIIDGLDHIENYNSNELDKYINFINKLKNTCKTIILTRPLQKKIAWKKQILDNWSREQTKKVLDELYHISDYEKVQKIYDITNGYPILVKYISEHYKDKGNIPNLSKLDSIDNYYEKIIGNEKGKQGLFIFLCSRSYFMKSEIKLLLEGELSTFVNQFIEEHPYLFEIRLNRISLFHDSFNTFLRKQDIDYNNRMDLVNRYVYNSIMNKEKRFLSRFAFFYLEQEMKVDILKRYTSIDLFKELFSDVIDFEAIQSFYSQLREVMTEVSPDSFGIKNYYDFALIYNAVNRDHASTINTFLYTYIRVLLFNGYTEEDITSSKYLFAMLYYVKMNDANLLYNLTSNDNYDTQFFFENLNYDKEEENYFFDKHKEPITKEKIIESLEDKKQYNSIDTISIILENIYIHKNKTDFPDLYFIIDKYMHFEESEAVILLEDFLKEYNIRDFFASLILKNAKRNILALGNDIENNDYLNLTLKEYLIKYKELGSFDLWVEILNYIRLSLHNSRKIDISNIALFWTKYHQRKDYSLINIDTELKIFEEHGCISLLNSCKIIKSIQEISEKGYRGLLTSFIRQHPSEIIDFILKNFNFEELRVSWFNLPSNYIDKYPSDLFNYALNEVLNENRHSKQINYRDIANVLSSKWANELKRILIFIKYKIRVSNLNEDIKRTVFDDVEILEFYEEKSVVKNNSQAKYNQGILTIDDSEFILENNLKSYEVAGFSDDNYDALSNIDIFNLFKKEDIKENIKLILYNALLGKIRSISMFNSLYHFPGNLIKLINDYDVRIDMKELFNSFLIFLDISMLELNE